MDAAQGTQFNVVILTMVRSGRRLGNVADEPRVNVARTRAKDGLLLVCAHKTLCQDARTWTSYFDWAFEKDVVTLAEQFLKDISPVEENPDGRCSDGG